MLLYLAFRKVVGLCFDPCCLYFLLLLLGIGLKRNSLIWWKRHWILGSRNVSIRSLHFRSKLSASLQTFHSLLDWNFLFRALYIVVLLLLLALQCVVQERNRPSVYANIQDAYLLYHHHIHCFGSLFSRASLFILQTLVERRALRSRKRNRNPIASFWPELSNSSVLTPNFN